MTLNSFHKAFLFILISGTLGCGTARKNYLGRAYRNITAYYNTYFNAQEIYNQDLKKIELANPDHYDRILAFYKLGDEASATGLTGDMDLVIKKLSDLITRHEKSDWVAKSYILMGKAYYLKGDYIAALDNFGYVYNTYPNDTLRTTALVWSARSSMKLKKDRDAQSSLDLALSSSQKAISKNNDELYSTAAKFALEQNDTSACLDYLEKAIKGSHNQTQKIRYHFILAELEYFTGKSDLALVQYQTIIKLHPPYDTEFGARLGMAGLLGNQDIKAERLVLNTFLKDEKNIEFQDQILYTLGKVCLKEGRVTEAIQYFNKSLQSSLGNGNQKGLNYEQLAFIYLNNKKDYLVASTYFDSTVTFLDKDYPNYPSVQKVKLKLSDLVSNYLVIDLGDTLLSLAGMDLPQRKLRVHQIMQAQIQKQKEAELRTVQAYQKQLALAGAQYAGSQAPTGLEPIQHSFFNTSGGIPGGGSNQNLYNPSASNQGQYFAQGAGTSPISGGSGVGNSNSSLAGGGFSGNSGSSFGGNSSNFSSASTGGFGGNTFQNNSGSTNNSSFGNSFSGNTSSSQSFAGQSGSGSPFSNFNTSTINPNTNNSPGGNSAYNSSGTINNSSGFSSPNTNPINGYGNGNPNPNNLNNNPVSSGNYGNGLNGPGANLNGQNTGVSNPIGNSFNGGGSGAGNFNSYYGGGGSSTFYFNNPNAMASGYSGFLQKWGNRTLKDNWRASSRGGSLLGDTGNDSTKVSKNGAAVLELASVNPKKAEDKFLSLIAKSPHQTDSIQGKMTSAYVSNAEIFENDLKDYPNTLHSYSKALELKPDTSLRVEIYYRLYSLYQKLSDPSFQNQNPLQTASQSLGMGNSENVSPQKALSLSQEYREKIIQEFPRSNFATFFLHPEILYSKKEPDTALERYYDSTYVQYLRHHYPKVIKNMESIPAGKRGNYMESKFAYLKLMSTGYTQPLAQFEPELKKFEKAYTKDSLGIEARRLLKAIDSNRVEYEFRPTALEFPANENGFELAQRIQDQKDAFIRFKKEEAEKARKTFYKPDYEGPFQFIILLKNQKANLNAMRLNLSLFEQYNFPRLSLKNTMGILAGNIPTMYVASFPNMESVISYYQKFEEQKTDLVGLPASGFEYYFISKSNYQKLVDTATFHIYRDFFNEEMLPYTSTVAPRTIPKKNLELKALENLPSKIISHTPTLFSTLDSKSFLVCIFVKSTRISLNSIRLKLSQYNKARFGDKNLGQASGFLENEYQTLSVGNFPTFLQAKEYYAELNKNREDIINLTASQVDIFIITHENLQKIKSREIESDYLSFFDKNFKAL